MDRYAALAYTAPSNRHTSKIPSQPPAGNGKGGLVSAATSSTSGSIKPATPTTLVTRVQRLVQEAMRYLGCIKACEKINIPPEVEILRTTAYFLSLPTGRQLSLISGNVGHTPAYKSVCEKLDQYNLQARNCNHALKLTDKLNEQVKTQEAGLANQRARCQVIVEEIKKKQQQLAQWAVDCESIDKKLQNRPSKPEVRTLKTKLKRLKNDIACEIGKVENLRWEKEVIESKIRIDVGDLTQLLSNRNSARGQLLPFQRALSDDLKALDEQLQEAIKTPGSGHAGALLALRNGLRDAETLRGLRTDWRYWEMLGVSPAEYDDVAANPTKIQSWLDLRFSAKEALSFRNAGYTDPTKLTYLRGTGVTGPIARKMHAFGYTRDFFPQEVDEKGHQVSAATYGFTLGMHHDAWAENDAVRIGSGSFNAPMGGYYRDTTAGAASMQVFKKERFVTVGATDPTDNKPITLEAGQEYAVPDHDVLPIFEYNNLVSVEDLHAPRTGLRNVLAYKLSQALGLTVIVRSEFSARSVPLTSKEIDAVRRRTAPVETFSFGISMQGVEGTYGYVNDKVVLPTDPETSITMIEELTDLQLFDSVTGEGDRHSGNILIDKNGHVFGIDGDQCFPDLNADNPAELVYDHRASSDSGKRGVFLPRIITKAQRDKWLAMKEQTVVEALHMATAKQRNAAIARFRVVQAHIRSLPIARVIDRSELRNTFAQNELRCPLKFLRPDGSLGISHSSYYGRYFG